MDLQLISDIMNKLDVVQLAAIVIILWVFYNRLDGKISASEKRLEAKIDQSNNSIENLRGDIHELDKRLCRLEGAFTMKECCAVQSDKQQKKIAG